MTDLGEVSSGFNYLVTRIPDQVPPTIVREEGAYLDQEESADYYSILEIEIPLAITFPISAFCEHRERSRRFDSVRTGAVIHSD